jgi:iron(III) transport system substrate-binding protein
MVVLPQEDSMMRLLLMACLLLAGCKPSGKYVVVYTSQDQVFAEPVLREFEKQTGIAVRPVFDSESVKTAGLVHRLNAEASHPQCDLFWNNEELLSQALINKGVLERETLAKFGYRQRVMVFNTNLINAAGLPKSLSELAQPRWKSKVALAYPVFGTTFFHFVALRQKWGETEWKNWVLGLKQNGARIVDGNSVVVKLVGKGEAVLGLSDSDDAAAALREGFPIQAVFFPEEMPLISNTVGIVKGAPHREEALQLQKYLASDAVVEQLVSLNALKGKDKPGDSLERKIDLASAVGLIDETREYLGKEIVRQ